MGLFTGLLLLPLAPVRGTVWIAQQLAAEAGRALRQQDEEQGGAAQEAQDEEAESGEAPRRDEQPSHATAERSEREEPQGDPGEAEPVAGAAPDDARAVIDRARAQLEELL